MRPSRPKMQPSHFWPEKIRAQAEGDFYSHKLIVSVLIILNSIPRGSLPSVRRIGGATVGRFLDGPRASHRFPGGFSEAKNEGQCCTAVPAGARASSCATGPQPEPVAPPRR